MARSVLDTVVQKAISRPVVESSMSDLIPYWLWALSLFLLALAFVVGAALLGDDERDEPPERTRHRPEH